MRLTPGDSEGPRDAPDGSGREQAPGHRAGGRFGRVMRRIGRFFLYFFAVIGGLITVPMVSLILFAVFYGESVPELPDRMVLRLDLEGGIADGRSDDPWRKLSSEQKLYLREAVAALAVAEADERVAGVVLNIGGASLAIAHAQELRDAIASFRESGRFAMAFAPGFGGLGNGTAEYYLAASTGEIWMQPSGLLALLGIGIETPYLKDAFDKVGIEPEFAQRHEYKSAVESLTRKTMSAPARESLTRLVESWMEQIVSGIAADRNLAPDAIRALVDRAPLLAEEAREAQLIDRFGYADAVSGAALGRAGPGAVMVDLAEYATVSSAQTAQGTKVALIYGMGPIQSGDGENSPFGSEIFAADSVARAIDDAVEDASIRAILLRVDSPGGSYIASDTVRRAVRRSREGKKPVIVSMGRYGASGGYFVSMGADKIVAQPSTLTGSIGVFGGKFATEAMWAKLGINWTRVSAGAHAGMWSSVFPFSGSAAARHEAVLDFIYRDFTDKLATDREMPESRIDQVARGRVWTGVDAYEAGLVDAVGGYAAATGLVRDALQLAPDAPLEFVILPEPLSPFEQLRAAFSQGMPLSYAFSVLSGGHARSGALDAVLRDLEPLVGDTSLLRRPAGMLQLPPFRIVQ